nr:CHAT domain-containing protein [uncultured Psychroserpens sp.]
MAKRAKLYGNKVELDNTDAILPSYLNSKFDLKTIIEVSSTRSENKAFIIDIEPDEILSIQFSDDTEWIGYPDDLQEIYDPATLEKRSINDADYLFETQISSEDQSRGLISRAIVKLFSVFTPKTVAKTTITALAKTYDKKIQQYPGLYSVDREFKLSPIKGMVDNKHLLFLHGTLSTTVDAFASLKTSNIWEDLLDQYNENIIALEHHTLSLSPLQNALDFLNACPSDCHIDIISHSRGGLIADVLAKCDYRNYTSQIGFSENELLILKKEDKVSYNLMLEINKVVELKRLKIDKIVRVASPASGTTILSRRVDHFFNLLLNAVSLAFGVRNPMYSVVKSFLLELISQKENPEVLPGLNSMMPESAFQKMMNAADTFVTSDLYVISGDSDLSGVNFNSLKVILANLFYRAPNDLVVDTNRMKHGFLRKNGVYEYLSKGGETNHFKYFSNSNSQSVILEALQSTSVLPAISYTKISYTDGTRGVVLDLFSMEGFSLKPKNITRDVVIIIPGIMGSSLSSEGEEQWVNMRNLNKGAIPNDLNISSTKVKASGAIKKFYLKIAEYFSSEYDVITLEFDWRKSVAPAAQELADLIDTLVKDNVNVNIVAHSMGGLVARQCMMSHQETWKTFSKNETNKFLMLGTPWLGSYLIMEVLTGHSKRVKQLAAIDFKSNRKDLLKIFWKFPGVFELLPIEAKGKRDFWNATYWDGLDKKSKLKDMPSAATNKTSLKYFDTYRKNVISFLEDVEGDTSFFENVYYISGKADKTVFDYKYKDRLFSKFDQLVYKTTSYGDGSVTWQTGIPTQLKGSKNLYYSNTSHGDLANETYIFEGIKDIIKTGSTNRLSTQEPRSRSGEIIGESHEFAEPLYNEDDVVNSIFGCQTSSPIETENINVTVVNGDLKVASYPVLVGHFFMDMILSAEKALDGYLNNRLSQRMDIGYYPGKIGESEVFFNLNTQPKGAIICGLGDNSELTTYLLAKTVKLAALKYAMFMRDNYTLPRAKRYANGISAILIGIGYGKLPLEDSIKGILLGLSAANTYIIESGDGLKPIKNLEIINFYESIASQAYLGLSRIKNNDKRISFNLNKGIVSRAGAKKKQMFSETQYNWWYNLHISSVLKTFEDLNKKAIIDGFKYFSSNGLARVEKEMVGIGMDKIHFLLEENSYQSFWDKRLSKTLFEMLIPNDFKNIFRNQTNMIIKLDKASAQIPWELLHDSETDETPASVTSSFIRQLVTENSETYLQVELNNNYVFVVGDPNYQSDSLPQLSAAKEEAEWLSKQLNSNGFKAFSFINSDTKTIMMEMFNRKYKMLHFSGHGLYDVENDNIGIAIGNGMCIDPAMINQIGYVPDFVFINCCYSGTINIEDDKFTKDRYLLAANIGTQLIEMGVKAIVISGWAVDDNAARTFSEVFYEKMFDGYDFGTSVQKARLACYQNHQKSSTWGAYQCYGNQFYRFNNRKNSMKDDLEYVISSQVYTDLDNLLIAIKDRKYNTNKALSKLEHYLEKVEEANLLDANILEKEALVYNELGKSEIALQKFKDLFLYASGNFSIQALEEYCKIKTNHLNSKNILEDLKEIEFLTLIGKNPTRLNIVANAYKFASIHFDEKSEQIKHLEIAFKLYEESYKGSIDPYHGSSLDAISNLIFIGHILELLGQGKLLDRMNVSKAFENVVDVESYLLDLYNELEDYDKTDLDISVLIGMAEASYGLILLKSNFKPDIEIQIIDKFKDVFALLYSPKFIDYEIIQIDFLLKYMKDDVIRDQLEQIKTEINKLII